MPSMPLTHTTSWPQALGALAAATKLTCLNLTDCSVSEEGVEELRKALPASLALSYTSGAGAWDLFIDSVRYLPISYLCYLSH